MPARTATASTKRTRTATTRSASLPLDESPIVEVPGYGTLTAKQKRFAEAYRTHGNATRAAQDAGYGASNSDAFGDIGYQLLRNVKVRWYIAFLGRNDELTQGDVLDMLRGEAVHGDHAGARVRAQELLGKSRGMFADDINLRVSTAPDEELARTIAGDDETLFQAILKRLRGE